MLNPLNGLVEQYNMACMQKSQAESAYKDINIQFDETLNNYEKAINIAGEIFQTPNRTHSLFNKLKRLLEDNLAVAKGYRNLLSHQIEYLKALNIKIVSLKRQIDSSSVSPLKTAPNTPLELRVDRETQQILLNISSPGQSLLITKTAPQNDSALKASEAGMLIAQGALGRYNPTNQSSMFPDSYAAPMPRMPRDKRDSCETTQEAPTAKRRCTGTDCNRTLDYT